LIRNENDWISSTAVGGEQKRENNEKVLVFLEMDLMESGEYTQAQRMF
jgi:hypothetical protein